MKHTIRLKVKIDWRKRAFFLFPRVLFLEKQLGFTWARSIITRAYTRIVDG